MQSDIQKRIQNTFIISIVAHGVFSLIFIVRYFFSIPTDFFTTMIMGCLSLIAEYQSKTVKEAQHRPFFIIDEIIE